jgi:hypothetical protein
MSRFIKFVSPENITAACYANMVWNILCEFGVVEKVAIEFRMPFPVFGKGVVFWS